MKPKPTVLVTGASGGIGRAICSQFIREGYRVLGQTTQANYSPWSQELEFIYGDFSTGDTCQQFINSLGKDIENIEILVNCAGSGTIREDVLNLSQQKLMTGFSVNFLSAFLITQAVLPSMVAKRSGVIINIGSNTTSHDGSSLNFDYFISKSALEAMTLYLNKHFSRHNIRINCIKPGLIDSGMVEKIPNYSISDFNGRMKLVPAGRPGFPDEIAKMVSFLANDSGSYVMGQIFSMAGGE